MTLGCAPRDAEGVLRCDDRAPACNAGGQGLTLALSGPMRRPELQLAENEQDDQHDNDHPDDTDPAIAAHAAS